MSAEVVFVLSHWLVRTFNTAVAAGADHTDAHTLPLLAALRATCVASRGSVSDALALLRRVRLPSDGALLAHPELLPSLASLDLSRTWRNVPPPLPAAAAWPALRALCVSDCRCVSAAWLAGMAAAAPNVAELRAARCTLDVLRTNTEWGYIEDDDAVGAAGTALLPWAPKLRLLQLSGAAVSTCSLALLLRACRRLRVLQLDGGACRVDLQEYLRPDGREVYRFTDATAALLNALRACASRLQTLDLSDTPSLHEFARKRLTKILRHLPADARLVLNCCKISAETQTELAEALPECSLVCSDAPDDAITAAADEVRRHAVRSHDRGRVAATRAACHAVRCDWGCFQRVLAADVVERLADADCDHALDAAALLGTRGGFVAYLDSVGVCSESETADLCILRLVARAPAPDSGGAAWDCAAPLQHNVIPFDAVHEEDHEACYEGRFRKAPVVAALQAAIHESFFSVGDFACMRLFALAVPPRYRRDDSYLSDEEDEEQRIARHERIAKIVARERAGLPPEEDEEEAEPRCPPHCNQPRTAAQDAELGRKMLQWAATAEQARVQYQRPHARFDPPLLVNPWLMAVVDPPCRYEDATGGAWADNIVNGSWFSLRE